MAAFKIAINRWTMPGDWDVKTCLRVAKESGFDAIEFNMEFSGAISPATSDSDASRIRHEADALGIELSALSTGVYWQKPFTHPDPQVRAESVELCRHQLRLAQAMGIDAILVVPGIVTPDVPYDVAYERARAALQELIPEAERRKVAIALENVWNRFLLSPLEMRDFVDSLGSAYVGVYFDAGNILAYGYPQHWINILGTRIKRVHVKDFRTDIGNIQGFTNLLQGDVPWMAVRAALEAVGYQGYITAEVSGYRLFPELGLRHIADALRAVFQS
ncbi:MAG: sugar phosphate isomerase/epimerase [Fimbriimonadales bacterium]|nr:sugar phosphate isomerase/epimerase [Fimbriimonadales bacterium]MDW8051285.1 sugar phosphate isomerase/epimerase family protein [Armatimonadota bacterium]